MYLCMHGCKNVCMYHCVKNMCVFSTLLQRIQVATPKVVDLARGS